MAREAAMVANLPRISVVVPVLNGATTIDAQLDSILRQPTELPFEVIVSDDGSTDGTQERVLSIRTRDDRVLLITRNGPKQFGAGEGSARNRGVAAARAPLILFADADDVTARGWLEAGYEVLRDSICVDLRREYWKLNPGHSRSLPQYAIGVEFAGAPSVSGGALGIRRDVFREMGGFDENLGVACDTEFGLRLYRSGIVPTQVPLSVVHVRLSTSAPQVFRRHMKLATVAALLAREYGDLLALSPRTKLSALRGWLWLLLHARLLLTGEGRLRWARVLGRSVGGLTGWRRHGILVA